MATRLPSSSSVPPSTRGRPISSKVKGRSPQPNHSSIGGQSRRSSQKEGQSPSSNKRVKIIASSSSEAESSRTSSRRSSSRTRSNSNSSTSNYYENSGDTGSSQYRIPKGKYGDHSGAHPKAEKRNKAGTGVTTPDGASELDEDAEALIQVDYNNLSNQGGQGEESFEQFKILDDYINKKITRYRNKNRLKEDGTLKLTLAERVDRRAVIVSNALRKLFTNRELTGAVFSTAGQEWLYAFYSLAITARGVGAGVKGAKTELGLEQNAADGINAGMVTVALPFAVLSAATIGRDALVVQSKTGAAKRTMMANQEKAEEYVRIKKENRKATPELAQAYLKFMAASRNLASAKLKGNKNENRERSRTTINAGRAVVLQGMNSTNMNFGAWGTFTGAISSSVTSVSSMLTSVIGIINGAMYLGIGRLEYQKARTTRKETNARRNELKDFMEVEQRGGNENGFEVVTMQTAGKDFKVALVSNMDVLLNRKHAQAVRDGRYAIARLVRGTGDMLLGSASTAIGVTVLVLGAGVFTVISSGALGAIMIGATAVFVAAYLVSVVMKFKDKHGVVHREKRHQRVAQMLIDTHTTDELRKLFVSKVQGKCEIVQISQDESSTDSEVSSASDSEASGDGHSESCSVSDSDDEVGSDSGSEDGSDSGKLESTRGESVKKPGTITLSEILAKYQEKNLYTDYEVKKEREIDITENEYIYLHFMALATQKLISPKPGVLPELDQACIDIIKLTMKEEDIQAIVDGARGIKKPAQQLFFIKKYLAPAMGITFRVVKKGDGEGEVTGASRMFREMGRADDSSESKSDEYEDSDFSRRDSDTYSDDRSRSREDGSISVTRTNQGSRSTSTNDTIKVSSHDDSSGDTSAERTWTTTKPARGSKGAAVGKPDMKFKLKPTKRSDEYEDSDFSRRDSDTYSDDRSSEDGSTSATRTNQGSSRSTSDTSTVSSHDDSSGDTSAEKMRTKEGARGRKGAAVGNPDVKLKLKHKRDGIVFVDIKDSTTTVPSDSVRARKGKTSSKPVVKKEAEKAKITGNSTSVSGKDDASPPVSTPVRKEDTTGTVNVARAMAEAKGEVTQIARTAPPPSPRGRSAVSKAAVNFWAELDRAAATRANLQAVASPETEKATT